MIVGIFHTLTAASTLAYFYSDVGAQGNALKLNHTSGTTTTTIDPSTATTAAGDDESSE